MNKFLLFIGVAILAVSCGNTQTPEKILKKNLSVYMEKNANDPESYQAMETKIVDTIFIRYLAKFEISMNEIDISDVESKIKKTEQDQLDYPEIDHSSLIKTYNEMNEISRDNIKKLKALDSADIAYVISDHRCRLKNNFGALSVSNFMVATDEKMNILLIEDDKDKATEVLREDFKNRFMENYNMEK
jgi:hypothetical protein